MSKKKHIDRFFRDIADHHEEKFQAKDWMEMDFLLKQANLQTKASFWSQIKTYFSKSLVIGLGVGMALIPTSESLLIHNAENYPTEINQHSITQTDNQKQAIQREEKIADLSEQEKLTDIAVHQKGDISNTNILSRKNAIYSQKKFIHQNISQPEKILSNTVINLTKKDKKVDNQDFEFSFDTQPRMSYFIATLTNRPILYSVSSIDSIFEKYQKNSLLEEVSTKEVDAVMLSNPKKLQKIRPRYNAKDVALITKTQHHHTNQELIQHHQPNWESVQLSTIVLPNALHQDFQKYTRKKWFESLGFSPDSKDDVKKILLNEEETITKSESVKEDSVQKTSNTLKIEKKTLLQDSLVEDKKDYPIRKYHVGLVYPLSSSGLRSYQYLHEFALNGILGVTAAIKGLEISGLGNVTLDYVKGTQIAGFANYIHQDMNGIQVAGFTNLIGRDVEGIQVAGFLNLTGFHKILRNNQMDNPRLSKFSLQAAGFANIDTGNDFHIQASGFGNVARSIQGFQGSGFMNLAKRVQGVQASGFVNMAQQVQGVQVTGFMNIAQEVKGVQLGFINISDDIEGIPIGFLSIVKNNRYRAWEFWGGETFHSNIGFKIGVKRFYNIFATGTQYISDNIRWGIGWGFGTELDLSARTLMNVELLTYHVNESEGFTSKLNLLPQFKVNFTRSIGKGFYILGGPSFNMLFSDFENEDLSIGSKIAPYALIESRIGRTKFKAWVGFNIGLRF